MGLMFFRVISLTVLTLGLWGGMNGFYKGPTQSLTNPFSGLQVHIRDKQTGQSLPARVYLMDSAGKHWNPDGAMTYVKHQEHHFISPGSFEIKLPPGKYSMTVERGPEYRPWTSSIDLQAGQDRDETVRLHRWISMNQKGWYSGDLHNHRNLWEMDTLLLAEDLNLAPTLTDWVWEDHSIARPPQTSQALKQVDPFHVYSVLDKEVERLVNGPGAVDLLGLKSPIPFDGYRLYPANDRFCALAHSQGGYVDAEKITWRDAAALVALDQIDFAGIVHNHFSRHGVDLETDQWGMIPKHRPEFQTIAGMPLWSMEVYYRFLNCGFRLPVSAGSASGVKAAPLGYNRVYVKLTDSFSYAHWFQSLKAGHNFATNGPMLFLEVNGQEPGAELHLPSRQPARIRLRAEALSSGSLQRLEILFKGRIIMTVPNPDGSGRLAADFESNVSETGWIVARCFEQPGKTIRFAHTSPVYIQFGQQSAIVREDAQFFIDWIDREIEFYRQERGFKQPEHRAEMLSFFEKARGVYSKLRGN
jgi:hypothetical protein